MRIPIRRVSKSAINDLTEVCSMTKNIKTNFGLMVASKGEQKIAEFLHNKNIIFEYDVPINLNGQSVRPDFYFPNFEIVIEYG